MSFNAIEKDLGTLVKNKTHPAITIWNRLEGRPRSHYFERSLSAEVRDALWFLTRQWQMGELFAEDAGTPVSAKVHATAKKLDIKTNLPFETQVEQRPLLFNFEENRMSLDLRLLMGRQWLKLLKKFGIEQVKNNFIEYYGFSLPDPNQDSESAALYCAHYESFSLLSAVAGRFVDGGKIYLYLKENSTLHAYDNFPVNVITNLSNSEKMVLDKIGNHYLVWFENLFYQPGGNDSDRWNQQHLEYQFQVGARDQSAQYQAKEYYHGRLDWYNLDQNPDSLPRTLSSSASPDITPDSLSITQSLLPVPLRFQGMPNARWWTFEDGKTNFGDIKPDLTDIAKLLLIEFALIYANDWCLMPFTIPSGSVLNIEGIAVTNVFGERFWIEASGSNSADNWQTWRMFSNTMVNNRVTISRSLDKKYDASIVMLPTVAKVLESKPIEEILFIRDEMANMVFAIEKRVPLATGIGKSGSEVQQETRKYYQRIVDQQNYETGETPTSSRTISSTLFTLDETSSNNTSKSASIRYEIMNNLPEHWIPFIPVKVPGSHREIQLQRAAILRSLDSDIQNPAPISPRTSVLRKPNSPFYIFEEEIPRAGIRVTQSYQRTRWWGGKIAVWLGMRKQTGRGEGSSGLQFDNIKEQ